MKKIQIAMWAAVVALGAFGMTPAKADLIISCSGSGCSGTLASVSGNSTVTACASTCTYGDFTIGPLAMVGQLNAAGNLADTENLNVSSSGTGTLTLNFTETNLTAGSAAQFSMLFTGVLSGGLSATRTWWLDPTNGGGLVDNLGSCSTGGCGNIVSALQSLGGQFSLTEVISLTAGRAAGLLSSDDDITVPEPATLSIFGLGLLGLGAMRRRRKQANT